MFQKRVENIKVEKIDDNQEKNQEQDQEQKPSLSELKEQRKNELGKNINKAVEKMRGLGGKLLGVLKRIGGGAEYVLVADKAVASGVDALDSAMDNAAYWTSDVVDRAGEGIKKGVEGVDRRLETAENYVEEKYDSLGSWVGEKITGFKKDGRDAVQNFKNNRKIAEDRKQELDRAFRKTERIIKSEKNQGKIEVKPAKPDMKKIEIDKKMQGHEAELRKYQPNEEKFKEKLAMLRGLEGLSQKTQELEMGVGSQELMDKAA